MLDVSPLIDKVRVSAKKQWLVGNDPQITRTTNKEGKTRYDITGSYGSYSRAELGSIVAAGLAVLADADEVE